MSASTVISTFSGPGGSSLGYENSGCDVRVALDCAPDGFSKHIPETYRRNHTDTEFLEKDARKTTADELLDTAEVESGELDILDGSPPCSPFSSANTKTAWGNHKSGTLFDRYTYFVEEIQPRTFVAENVPDLAQGKTKGYYKLLCRNLRDAGYNLNIQKIDAAYLGAAHHRRRLMFIGVREDIGQPPKIEPTQSPTTVSEAWDGLNQNTDKIQREKKRMERSVKYDEFCKISPGKSINAVSNRDRFNDDYRLSFHECSPTPTAQANFAHPSEDRFITISELSRLMGIGEDYKLSDTYTAAWECCIRCLPPILLETIANKLQEEVL